MRSNINVQELTVEAPSRKIDNTFIMLHDGSSYGAELDLEQIG